MSLFSRYKRTKKPYEKEKLSLEIASQGLNFNGKRINKKSKKTK